MKVYNTDHPSLAKKDSLFFSFFQPLMISSVHLFQSNQRPQAIEFVDRHVSESSKFNLS